MACRAKGLAGRKVRRRAAEQLLRVVLDAAHLLLEGGDVLLKLRRVVAEREFAEARVVLERGKERRVLGDTLAFLGRGPRVVDRVESVPVVPVVRV